VATATLLGYAAGLLFVVPLRDGIDPKWLMIASALVSCAILIVVPISPNLSVMLGAGFALGFASVAPQLAVFVRVAAIAVRTFLMKNGPFIAPVVPGFVASVSRLFCVNFKPGLRMFGTGVHEKSAVKLRDF